MAGTHEEWITCSYQVDEAGQGGVTLDGECSTRGLFEIARALLAQMKRNTDLADGLRLQVGRLVRQMDTIDQARKTPKKKKMW